MKRTRRRLYRALGIKRHTWAHIRQPKIDLSRLLGEACKHTPFLAKIDLASELHRMGIRPRGIIHVGAHRGDEVDSYRAMGFERILMIEANPSLAAQLRSRFEAFADTRVVHAAVTDCNGEIALRITSMDQSSSILALKDHRKIYPNIREVRTVQVPARTLDHLLHEHGLCAADYNVLVLDIQGAEMKALRGAPFLLRGIDAVLSEFPTVPLYEGSALLGDLDMHLGALGLNRSAHSSPWHPTWGDALFVRRPVLAMTTLGANGRFGNQLFQYAFLKIAAARQCLALQVPDWEGRDLFGLDEPPVMRELPRFTQGGLQSDTTGPSLEAPETWFLENQSLPMDCDLWGYFQLHGSCWSPHLEQLRRLFTPVPVLERRLNGCLDRLAGMMPRIAAIHVRRGDFGYGPFFRAPCEWFSRWLDRVAPEQPAYLASDTPDDLRHRFRGRSMITAREISDMPPQLDWLVDFHVLRHAPLLAISNSSFSFMAAMLNANLHTAGRACAVAGEIIDFDPSNAPVLLRPSLTKTDHDRLAIEESTPK